MSNLLDTPKLGFGCMRLPLTDPKDQKSIDIEHVKKMVDAFMEAGGTYFDTAYVYHEGESEVAMRKALVERYPRDSFTIATKCLAWAQPTAEDAKACLDTSLKRLGTDYIDFYLLHSLHKARYEQAKELGIVDWLWEQKAAGRIRNFGFSCHDNAAGFEAILRDQPWDFCQLQYNYLDRDDRAEEISGDRGYQLTEECGVPLIIMEPIKGGTLASLPADAAAPLHALRPDATDASWALRWVGSHNNVHVILSGMSADPIPLKTTLYFPSEDGTKVLHETRTLEASTAHQTGSIQAVLDALCAGSERKGAAAYLPATTDGVSIRLEKKVCLLSLPDQWMQALLDEDGKANLAAWALSASLTELDGVNQVSYWNHGTEIPGLSAGEIEKVYTAQ